MASWNQEMVLKMIFCLVRVIVTLEAFQSFVAKHILIRLKWVEWVKDKSLHDNLFCLSAFLTEK